LHDAKIVSSTSERPAISVGEGPSRKKGKGINPRNWGNVDSSEEFTDRDFEAQRDALENFAEINQVIKREQFTTPGFFDEPEIVRMLSRQLPKQSKDSKVSSQKIEPKVPGQDTKERIAELRRELSILEQTEKTEPKPKIKPALTKAEQAVKNSIEQNIRRSAPRDKSRSMKTPVRVVAGSFIEQVLHDVDDDPPHHGDQTLHPSGPSDRPSSSSSSSDSSSSDDDRPGSVRAPSLRHQCKGSNKHH
jgi:hypothetical protein